MGCTDRKGALTDRRRRASFERRNRIYLHGADHAEFGHRNKRSRQQQEETPFRFTSSIAESRLCWSESKATAKPKFELPPPSPLKRTVQGPQKPTNLQKTRVSSERELDNQLEQEWMMPQRCYDTSNLTSLESYKKRIATLQAKFAYTSRNHHSIDCAGVEDKGAVIGTYRGGNRIEDELFDVATYSGGIETEGEGDIIDSGRLSFNPVVVADVEINSEREGEREEGEPPEEAVKRTQGEAGERDSKLKANGMIALATAELEALDVGKPPEEGELQCKRTHGKVAERDSKLKAIALDVGKPPEEGEPLYKRMHVKVAERDFKLRAIEMEIALATAKLEALQFGKAKYKEKQDDEENEDDNRSLIEREKQVVALHDALAPLDDKAEAEVAQVLKSRRRQEVLVMHTSSNIEITKHTLECLMPGAWLNDEVINLYFELLKEREKRDPEKFLKCHFFNTFFYKKLYNMTKYDYKAVRRWTTYRKIGYSLTDCDKIFVPIHKEIHWCLAIIDMRAKKFQYLDSLKGTDARVLQVLAKYIVDEAKDKTDQDLDVSNWDQEFVEDLPAQENGWDCGVFMIKYADFHSQDLPLSFSQENMPYFRTRTAKEILKLRAE